MGFDVGGGKGGARAEINVTPLVDVCLVLLVIFMVVTPMLQKNKEVQLPVAKNMEEGNPEEDPLTFSITADEKVWRGTQILTPAQVQTEVRQSLAKAPGRLVLLKGDSRLAVKQVRNIMMEIQKAGAKSVGLGVEDPQKAGKP